MSEECKEENGGFKQREVASQQGNHDQQVGCRCTDYDKPPPLKQT